MPHSYNRDMPLCAVNKTWTLQWHLHRATGGQDDV